jgi:hypothetical protein
MTRMINWARRWYGGHPLHLLALLAAFALAGYAVRAIVAAGQWPGFALWFVVAIVGHDLLLFPLYSLADLSLRRLLPRRARPGHARYRAAHRDQAPPGGGQAQQSVAGIPAAYPPVLNYIRVPTAFSLLLFLVWFPLILGLSEHFYHRGSGLTTQPYLGRWLAITGVLFGISAVSYALRLRRSASRLRKKPARKAPARPAPRLPSPRCRQSPLPR